MQIGEKYQNKHTKEICTVVKVDAANPHDADILGKFIVEFDNGDRWCEKQFNPHWQKIEDK